MQHVNTMHWCCMYTNGFLLEGICLLHFSNNSIAQKSIISIWFRLALALALSVCVCACLFVNWTLHSVHIYIYFNVMKAFLFFLLCDCHWYVLLVSVCLQTSHVQNIDFDSVCHPSFRWQPEINLAKSQAERLM